MAKWQKLMEKGVSDVQSVAERIQICPEELATLASLQERYPMFINDYYLSLIHPDQPDDPIRKMCVPSIQEQANSGSFDTSGEQDHTVLPGLQHKYSQTALILSTHQCAMYCRFCFRKRMVGLSDAEICRHIPQMASYVQNHPEITNVLISGGDAFMNSNDTLRQYLDAFSRIRHLDLIRFGTRTPVVLPQRITSDPELIDLLREYNRMKQLYVVTHFNHPREITAESTAAVKTLLQLGIPVRNQTVLLKDINDDSEVLGTLLRRLTSIGVQPYYVFQCRPVTGVMNHFQVPLKKGFQTFQAAMKMQSGQGKTVRYCLSHVTGKIEVFGLLNNETMLFRYHQAKDPDDIGRIFTHRITDQQCWL